MKENETERIRTEFELQELRKDSDIRIVLMNRVARPCQQTENK